SPVISSCALAALAIIICHGYDGPEIWKRTNGSWALDLLFQSAWHDSRPGPHHFLKKHTSILGELDLGIMSIKRKWYIELRTDPEPSTSLRRLASGVRGRSG